LFTDPQLIDLYAQWRAQEVEQWRREEGDQDVE